MFVILCTYQVDGPLASELAQLNADYFMDGERTYVFGFISKLIKHFDPNADGSQPETTADLAEDKLKGQAEVDHLDEREMRPENKAIDKLSLRVFDMLDETKSGTLVAAELRRTTENAMTKLLDEVMQGLHKEATDGEVSRQEWSSYWKTTDSGTAEEVDMNLKRLRQFMKTEKLAHKVFMLFDTDGNGYLHVSEVMDVIQDERASKFVQEIDAGGNQNISSEEWNSYWCSINEHDAEMKLTGLKTAIATATRIQHG